jgi:glycosyltransferase involved in cell wall biosynthesis
MLRVSRPAILHGTYPLIVHSHLRWDFVWQRPQQIMSRLARRRPVMYVEEPVFIDDASGGSLDITSPCANVDRVVPRLPSSLRGSYDAAAAIVRTLLTERLSAGVFAESYANCVQWFYTPMPAPAMLGAFGERGVVYDCMDELSQFRFAPPQLIERERLLMSHADIVFTGGRRLFESKSRHHRNVHFFGCGVDVDHFASACSEKTPVAPELRSLPRPVLGYFGVIDERLNYELIGRLATSFAHGSVVFVGPLAKVEASELPKQPNLHWLGQRAYAELPTYVKGFDVCLMPFALNAATEFINPTKTLEYMAGGKPIVSTAVPDVVRNFTPIVHVANSIDEFTHAVSIALKPDEESIRAGMALARASTWESIVGAMDALIARSIRHPAEESVAPHVTPRRVATTLTTVPAARPELKGDGTAHVA